MNVKFRFVRNNFYIRCMIRIFYRNGNKIEKDTDIRQLGQIDNIIWVDLQNPTTEEEEWVESKCAISIQTPAEIAEIESSSRFFEHNNEITANANFMRLENGEFVKYPVSFILKNHTLYTFRQADLSTFADVVRKIKANSETFLSGFDVLLSLNETRIDLDADYIEKISRDIALTAKVLAYEGKADSKLFLEVTRLQESTMMIRESIIDKQRVMLNLLKSTNFPEDKKERLRIILKDIGSLIEHSTFNFDRLEYIQDTFNGLINLEQNKVIKRFTMVSIMFLPPTLIAGMFGMNFQYIPLAGTSLGFLISLVLMFASSGVLLFYFWRKGWM